MPRPFIRFVLAFGLVIGVGSARTFTTQAASIIQPLEAGSSYDLINAVNTLRASYGLAPYSINSILMETAQAQAEFMAATGNVTHSGPGGIGLTDRLLAAGYPLAGDLSAGGFRAENITSGNENRTAQSAVDGWTGDALHLNTMISPNLSEIGAGVAVANDRVYYVIDCALPSTDVPLQGLTSSPGRESAEAPAASPTAAFSLTAPTVPVSPMPALMPTVTIIFTEADPSADVRPDTIMGVAIGILLLSLLGGGVFSRLGSKRKTDG